MTYSGSYVIAVAQLGIEPRCSSCVLITKPIPLIEICNLCVKQPLGTELDQKKVIKHTKKEVIASQSREKGDEWGGEPRYESLLRDVKSFAEFSNVARDWTYWIGSEELPVKGFPSEPFISASVIPKLELILSGRPGADSGILFLFNLFSFQAPANS